MNPLTPHRGSSLLPYLSAIACVFLSFPLHAQSGGTPTLDSQELAFLGLINNYRIQNGAGPLQVSIALENSSTWMSNDMAAKNYFSHTDSLGRDPFTRMATFGYNYNTYEGENIAAGNSDAQDTFSQWQTACDPDGSGNCTYAHRANMLNPNYVVIGIGRASGAGSTYGWYWTTDFGGFLDATLNTGTGSGSPAPVINSFTANPSSITAGQSSALTWSVSGSGVTISINNGVGTVSNSTSVNVAPTQSANYILTASNSGGSVTASVAVTVTAPQHQIPSTPSINSITAKSQSEVDLSWTASTDSLGIAGYQIIRNGAVIASVSGSTLSYADTGVTAGTTYSYNVRSYDSSGQFSNASNTVQVATPAPAVAAPVISSFTANPSNISTGQSSILTWSVSGAGVTISINNGVGNVSAVTSASVEPTQTITYTLTASNSGGSATAQVTVTVSAGGNSGGSNGTPAPPAVNFTACQAPAARGFAACYYGNTSLSGNAEIVRTDSQINFNWGPGSPGAPLPSNGFSASWQGGFNFLPGTYTFTALTSDGMRVYINGNLVLDEWKNQPPTTYTFQQTFAQGTYFISVFYYSQSLTSVAQLSWQQGAPAASPQAPVISSFTASPMSITAGQSTTLSWNVSGPGVTLSIDNGVGNVSSVSSASVQPTQTTTYTLTATNSAGTTRGQVTVTVSASGGSTGPGGSGGSGGGSGGSPTAPPASFTPCQPAANRAFAACYYGDTTLSGTAAIERTDNQINFNWGPGSPGASLQANDFSVSWQGTFNFVAGTYTFTAKISDGMRVYINGNLVLDEWKNQPPTTYTFQQTMTSGTYFISVEYYSQSATAVAQLSWQ